jgi:ferritin-like protein
MAAYHEPVEELHAQDRDIHRALNSLKEEVEAIDWYHQRAATGSDQELQALLIHNRDEEIEHAAMLLEWLRRTMPAWDEQLHTYLFTSGAITELEAEAEDESPAGEGNDVPGPAADLGIGNLK